MYKTWLYEEEKNKSHWTYCPMCQELMGEEDKYMWSFDNVPICDKCAKATMPIIPESEPDSKKDVT